MFYPYAEFPECLNVTFSQPIADDNVVGGEKILVNFEQPDENGGFKEARYQLPNFKLLYNDGFIPDEQRKNEDILKRNANLIVKYSKAGGVNLDL